MPGLRSVASHGWSAAGGKARLHTSPGIDDHREAFPGAGRGIETQPQRGCGTTTSRPGPGASGTRVGVRPVASAYPQGSRPDGLIPGLSSTSPVGMGAAAGRITVLSKTPWRLLSTDDVSGRDRKPGLGASDTSACRSVATRDACTSSCLGPGDPIGSIPEERPTRGGPASGLRRRPSLRPRC